jgi:hypothetical protein
LVTAQATRVIAAAAAASLMTLGVGLGRRSPLLIGAAIGVFGVEYGTFVGLRAGDVDALAPAVGVAALIVAELALAAIEPGVERLERAAAVQAVVARGSVALTAAVLGAVVLAASGAVEPSVAAEVLGAAAAVVAVALVVGAAARVR